MDPFAAGGEFAGADGIIIFGNKFFIYISIINIKIIDI